MKIDPTSFPKYSHGNNQAWSAIHDLNMLGCETVFYSVFLSDLLVCDQSS